MRQFPPVHLIYSQFQYMLVSSVCIQSSIATSAAIITEACR